MMRWAPALIAVTLLAGSANARGNGDGARNAAWVASWGAAQMIADGDDALPADRAGAITLRQIVRLSVGGTQIRVRFSNAFGTRPLAIGAAHLARAAGPGTARIAGGARLTFAGQPGAVIPPGAELYADPVALPVAPGADLAVSLYLPDAPAPQTGHPGARATGYTLAGNHVADAGFADATAISRWYALADIDVSGPAALGTIVTIGDSITDGYGVTPDSNRRWPDILAARLRARAATRGIGVVNAGIGGNRVLLDGLGPNLLARFDRDVIARSGVRWAIVLEGINDLGVLTRDAPATPAQHAAIVAQVTAAYRQIVARAHTHGIKVIGGTIMPFVGNDYYNAGPASEADRQAINRFIRSSGTFDAVIDFDAVMRDPARPDRLAPALDSGDQLHPSEAGYRAMAAAVPLGLFADASATAIGNPRRTIARAAATAPAAGLRTGGVGQVGPAAAATTLAGPPAGMSE